MFLSGRRQIFDDCCCAVFVDFLILSAPFSIVSAAKSKTQNKKNAEAWKPTLDSSVPQGTQDEGGGGNSGAGGIDDIGYHSALIKKYAHHAATGERWV